MNIYQGDFFKYCIKIEHDKIIYALNEDKKEAYIFDNNLSDSFWSEVIIPRSIEYEGQQFTITMILEESFKNTFFYSIEFPSDSAIQIIGKESFSKSRIQKVNIPPSVTKICENAFYFCCDLKVVEISPDSNLQIIEKNAFSSSNIESIFIPDKVVQICEGAFSFNDLKNVNISENSELRIIERSAFSSTLIQNFL